MIVTVMLFFRYNSGTAILIDASFEKAGINANSYLIMRTTQNSSVDVGKFSHLHSHVKGIRKGVRLLAYYLLDELGSDAKTSKEVHRYLNRTEGEYRPLGD